MGVGKTRRKAPLIVLHAAGVERAPAEAVQQILDLVEGLNRRGRIVDGRGEGLDGDVHQQPQGILGVLLEGAFPRDPNRLPERGLRQRLPAAMHAQQQGVFGQGVADGALHHDHRIHFPGQPDQGTDLESSDRLRLARVAQRLADRALLGFLGRDPPRLRRCISYRIQARKHRSNDLAPLLADEMEDVGDLNLVQPLYQPGENHHAEDQQHRHEQSREQGHRAVPPRSIQARVAMA